ncbi:MAG: DUF1580 domain-containing protein [Thermoguttaceae bacterium]
MSIDISAERLFSLADTAKTLPGRPAISTLHRWRLRGVRGVRLETCLIGGRRFTSREALERFISATTAAANGERPPTRTPRQRQRAIDQAERDLGLHTDARRGDVHGVVAKSIHEKGATRL